MQRYMALLDWMMKTSVIGISTVGVSQLRNIGTETARLNDALGQLRLEVSRINEVQIGFLERYKNLGDRVDRLEEILIRGYDEHRKTWDRESEEGTGDHHQIDEIRRRR